MSRLVRAFKTLLALAAVAVAGTLPACGTMGGGGMKYLVDPPQASTRA